MADLNLAISLLMLYGGWTIWRKATLDHCRDKLFDAREAIRDGFIKKGRPLNDPAYLEVRDSINGRIQLTESFSLISLVFSHRLVKSFGVLPQKTVAVDDEGLKIEIERTRMLSNTYVFNYLVESSPILLITSIFFLVTFFVRGQIKGIWSRVSERILAPILNRHEIENMATAT